MPDIKGLISYLAAVAADKPVWLYKKSMYLGSTTKRIATDNIKALVDKIKAERKNNDV